MKWTEPKPPTKGVSYYDHTTCQTPLGRCKVEWKSWKNSPDYDLYFEDEYITFAYTLEEAKEMALEYLINTKDNLDKFLAEKVKNKE
jgi:hypothetical protein